MKKTTVLVTGGAGFIGSHIVDALIEKGFKVIVIDNLSTGFKKNVHDKAIFYKMSLASSSLQEVFKKYRPEYVYHLAAQIDVRISAEDPLHDAQINVLGTLRLLEQCVAYKCKKIIFSSTGGAIYGDVSKRPTPETEKEEPISPYGIAKLSAEKYMRFYAQQHDIEYVALRYANVYGPRQSVKGEAGVIAKFIIAMLHGDTVRIFGDGKHTRDYVYVKDVVRANMLALSSKAKGVYNVGTAKETSVNQLAGLIKKQINDTKSSIQKMDARAGDVRYSSLDYSKIKKVLGWKPETNVREGIEQTVNWFKNKA